MKYKEYRFFTEAQGLDELIEKLNIKGINEFIINDPRDAEQFSNPSESFLWNYADADMVKELESGAWVSIYTEENDSSEVLTGLMKDYDCKISISDDQDWLHKWEEYCFPTKIGQLTVAKPVWREYTPQPGEIVIEINPGMAFGTGSSPTTYMAVRLMEKYVEPGDKVLDVGCGTGILSVLAAKLGASHVDAIDLDPEAVRSTKENIKLNGCQDKVDVYLKDLLEDCQLKAPVIVANLTADIILRLLSEIGPHLDGRKYFIISGIIDDKEELVKEELKKANYEILEIMRDDCWTAMLTKAQD